MTARHLVPGLMIVALGMTVGTGAAYAQVVPAADVSFGYSFLGDADETLPVGFFGDVGVSVTDKLQIVGEVARHMGTATEFGIDVDLSETSFLVGPRFVSRNDSATGYFQALVGGANLSGDVNTAGFDVGVSVTAFVLQVGGGAVVPISDNVGFKFSADYQWLNSDEFGSGGQYKVSAGVSFALGAR